VCAGVFVARLAVIGQAAVCWLHLSRRACREPKTDSAKGTGDLAKGYYK